MKKQDEGFTLIELLIVIVILGILATVVVFAVSGIRDQGDQSACEAELRSVLTGLEAYYADNGAYPANVSAIEASYFRTDVQYWATSGGNASAVTAPAQGSGATASCG